MSRALAFLGVQPGEERTTALMTAHSFFMGCATVFFETAATALFLSQFEGKHLPWVYLAAAAVNMVTGTLYSTIKERVSFARLMSGTVWFLLLSVLAVRFGIVLSNAPWLVFGSLVWYRVISILTDLEYWAVAARLYDVRQAKRLFGLIGTGEVTARIVGSFSVPLFVKLVGVANLMLLSAGALGLCAFFLLLVMGQVGDAHAPSRAQASKTGGRSLREQFDEVLGTPYLRIVVFLAVLATFGKYFVDFAFLQQLKLVPGGKEALAGFFGVFSGLTQTLSLLTRLFLSGLVLNRFGIRVGLVVLPLIHVACTLLIVTGGASGMDAQTVFWFVIANQGIYKVFKHPIDNPSFKVLYQPLKSDQRLAAQIAVEVIFTPVVIGIAGAVMLLFSAGMRYDPVRFSWVLLLNFVAWAFLARGASRAYTGALLDVLRRRIVDDEPVSLDDAGARAILRAKLDSPSPAEVMFALHLLEKADDPGIADALLARVGHASPEVRRYALERVQALRPAAALPALRWRASAEELPGVRAVALQALAAGGGDAVAGELLPQLDHADALVRRGAMAGLLGLRDEAARAAALRHLRELAGSDRPEDRVLVARIAGAHDLDDFLPALLHDADPGVRRAALLAAGRLRRPAFRPALVRNLPDPRFAGAASAALAAEGEPVLAALEPLFTPQTPRATLAQIARIHGQVGGKAAVAALASRLAFPDESVRAEILAALDRLRFRAEGPQREPIERLVRDEAAEAVWTLRAWRDLGNEAVFAPLRRAIEDELLGSRARLFVLLSFVHGRTALLRARDHLAHASKDKRAYALEVLDVVLPGEARDELLPLLESLTPAQRLLRLGDRLPAGARPAPELLRELIARPERRLRAWTRACAIHAAAESGLAELAPAIAEASSPDPVVGETAAWALERLRAGGVVKGDRSMLLIEKVMILKGVQMFAETSEEILAEVAAILEEIEVRAGQAVISKGDLGDSMYVIISGRMRVHDGEQTIRELGEREIFGELALLDPEPRSASVTALADSRLFRLDRETFSQLMAGNIEIVRGVLHVLCERLRRGTPRPTTGSIPVVR